MTKSSSQGLWIIVRVWLGLIFLYAGWTKVTAPFEDFRAVMASYELLPYASLTVLSYLVPWTEFLAGVFLLAGYETRWSAMVLAVASLSVSTMMVAYFIKSGSFPADCGCFGVESLIHLSGKQVFFLDVINTFIGLELFLHKDHVLTLDAALK